MAKPDETAEKREQETPWGTWEELLLACAVHRYGTKCWESVAIEIQKRSSTSALHHLLTPHHCKLKFHDLRSRYTPQNDAVLPTDHNDDDKADTVPWLDELRKLRVAELKSELERYDLSIVSLQLKVKRLKEEREESLREGENGGEKSDLEKSAHREREEEEKREESGEPEKSSPESIAGEESDRDNQSVNESNSTDPKGENHKTEEDSKDPQPVGTGDGEPDGRGLAGDLTKPVGEDSCNGSSDSIEKKPVLESVKAETEGGASDSPELWESVAESKGGGGGEEGTTKESSDVQSSASKSRKGGGSDKVRSGCISASGDEPENEDQSPAMKRISVESQPMVDFLEIVQAHKLGSVFERRLESQETPEYKNLIRQHIDLEIIRMRLEEGWYSGCNSKFFRDLLLLFNNAIVFFDKKSRESAAAIELRQLISKEMPQRSPMKSDLSAGEQTSLPPVPLSSKPEPEPSDSLLLKPKISVPMIVCRKRSSIVAKASGSSSGAERKREQKAPLLEEKPILDWKQPNKSSSDAEEHRVTKKRTRDRFASASRSSKKIGKTRSNSNTDKNSEALPSQNQGKGASSSKHSEAKSEKDNTPVAVAKKRSAANFLNRMKQSSSPNNGSLLDTLKSSAIRSNNNRGGGGGGGGGAAENKRSGNGRGDGRKDQASRRGSGGRQAKEQESPAKRSVGRPPKRAAAPPHTPSAVSGKRSREGGDTEAAASRQPKKRSRK